MSSNQFFAQPRTMEIRVVECGGKRVLQQYRQKPGGYAHEFDWVDLLDLPKPATVSRLKPR